MNKILALCVLLLLTAAHNIAANNPKIYSIERENRPLCHYYFDKSNTQDDFSILLILQGSETTSAFQFYTIADPCWLKKFNVAVLIIEKPGVTNTTFNQYTYLQYNSLTQRADDCKMVVDHLRKTQKSWNGKLLISGFSEGSILAALLGPQIPETNALIMLAGGGGMTLREEILLLETKNSPPGITHSCWNQIKLTYLKLMFAGLKFFPNNSTYTFLGTNHSLKYWNAIADYKPLYSLEKLDIPLYLVHGSVDTNCPIESAEILVRHFKEIGKNNLFYRMYTGYDHTFNDREGINHMGEIFDDSLEWVQPFLD